MFKLRGPYRLLFAGSTLLLIVLYLFTLDVPFFWDAYSKSIRATWFLENDFSQFVIPNEINAGHPPLWELNLAFIWKIFGRSLWSSRLLLLIFNLGVFWQLIRFLRDNKIPSLPIWALIIVLIEPTLLAQSTIINNDMMLLFFTLLGLNAIYRNEKLLFAVALTGVLFSNLRGSSVFISLFIIDFIYSRFQLKKDNQKPLWISYLPPILLFGGFLMYQYNLLGWILKKPGLSHREMAGFGLMAKNAASIVKSVLETGRLFMFGILGILILMKLKHKTQFSSQDQRLIIAGLTFFIVFSALFILMTNPVNPRYYLIVYLISALLCLNLIFETLASTVWKKLMTAMVFIGLLTGHLWVWPPTISQGWDTSLNYLNYFPLKDQMETYMQENGISKDSVGTNLNLNHPEFIDLKEKADVLYSDLDLEENPYVLFSNIENATSDEDIRTLQKDWILVKSYKRMGVFVNLYKNPSLSTH